jgi:hypothetical protein
MSSIFLIRKIFFFVVAMGLTSVNQAEARILCSSGSTSCYFSRMPIYNQNDTSLGSALLPRGAALSALCGPTSGSMVLAGVVSEVSSSSNIKSTSWTKANFLRGVSTMTFSQKQKHQITQMTNLMNTDVYTSGTSSTYAYRGAYGRKGDFLTAGGATSGKPISYPNSNYINYIKNDKSAVLINFGHYLRSSSISNGKTYYSYRRTGGHYVAQNGFSGSDLMIYDPWYGVKVRRRITTIYDGCSGSICQNVPGGLAHRSYLYASNGSYKFIEWHSRLWAN